MSNEIISCVAWNYHSKMFILNNKISLPLLVVFLGTATGALSGGEFVWTLFAAVGALALVAVVQNLSAFLQCINAQGRTILAEADGAMPPSLENSSDWLQKWNEDMDYCPTYKGTPGNIWNGPKWTSDD